MKKFSMFSIAAMAVAVLFTSCSDDDSGGGISNTTPNIASDGDVNANDFRGNIVGNVTLNEDGIYTLTGSIVVKSGKTFTIPAGVKIRVANASTDGTNRYILVEKGATININGTSAKPVVMGSTSFTLNSSSPDKDNVWGGLIIAGNATTTKGVNATGEVAGIVYGGTTNNDSSGTINYLVLRGSGAQINADSQFNGLTLYGVGSGTTINNVAIIGGEDDGVEFFGGTVSVSNFYIEDMNDDAIDWTEGWSGTIDNTLVIHNRSDVSTVLEGDGSNGGPTFSDLTVIAGATVKPSTGIFQFKATSGGTLTNISVTGYDITSDEWVFAGTLNTNNIITLDGAAMTTEQTLLPSFTSAGYTPNVAADFAWATGVSATN